MRARYDAREKKKTIVKYSHRTKMQRMRGKSRFRSINRKTSCAKKENKKYALVGMVVRSTDPETGRIKEISMVLEASGSLK